MKKKTIKKTKENAKINIYYDDYDITVVDSDHADDNTICLTRKEWKKVLKIFTKI